MKNYKILIAGLFLSVVFACDKKSETQVETSEISTTETAVEDTNDQPRLVEAADTEVQPATAQDVKLNPPHGEPGHRCEIPVGAPLDSAPAQAQPQMQAIPQQSNPFQQNGSTTVGNLNPPHGEPGHRCEIPVGAPLS